MLSSMLKLSIARFICWYESVRGMPVVEDDFFMVLLLLLVSLVSWGVEAAVVVIFFCVKSFFVEKEEKTGAFRVWNPKNFWMFFPLFFFLLLSRLVSLHQKFGVLLNTHIKDYARTTVKRRRRRRRRTFLLFFLIHTHKKWEWKTSGRSWNLPRSAWI